MEKQLPLSLTIEDSKAVASAMIKLQGLTVLCGPNATGKSTIAKTLRTLVESSLYYRDCRRCALLSDYSREIVYPFRRALMFSGVYVYEDEAELDFDMKFRREPVSVEAAEEYLSVVKECVQTKGKKLRIERLTEMMGKRFFALLKAKLPIKGNAVGNVVDAMLDSIEDMRKKIRQVDMEKVTSKKFVGLPFDRSILWNGIVDFQEGGDSVFSYDGASIRVFGPMASIRNVIYLESPLVSQPLFDEGRVKIAGNVTGLCAADDGIERVGGREFFDALGLVISGKIDEDKKRKRKVAWEYKREDGERFPYQDCATGIKSFAILSRIFEHGCLNPHTLLIIDEPEAHLHPAWVVEYAAILVKLIERFGVRVMVASHSPDMVNALQSFVLCRNLSNRAAFYQAEAVSKKDPYRFKFKSLNVNVGKIFDSFNGAYALIEARAKEMRESD